MTPEAPTDVEIDAYLDDALDLDRRFVVETYLSRHPTLAARVMADFGSRSALRILMNVEQVPPGPLLKSARHLEDRPKRALWRRGLPLGGLAAIGLAAVIALFVSAGAPPGYVDLAAASHRTAMMRASMVSQVETPRFDAKEILSSARIDMPRLPVDWRVTDVQLFPSEEGTALLIAVKTVDGTPLTIFVLRARTSAPQRPDAVRDGKQSVAYWRNGNMSYALTGDAEPAVMDATAEALVRGWS